MLYFMLFTCIVELIGRALALHKLDNNWLYNIYLIGEVTVITVMFSNFVDPYVKSSKWVTINSSLLIPLYLFELYRHGPYQSHDLTINVMSVLFTYYSLLYYHLLLKDVAYHELIKDPAFWWVAGSLFYYFGTTACNIYFLIFIDEKSGLLTNRNSIYMSLNIILYSFRSYSFLCRYQQRKLTP
jgi:hypothetical protein